MFTSTYYQSTVALVIFPFTCLSAQSVRQRCTLLVVEADRGQDAMFWLFSSKHSRPIQENKNSFYHLSALPCIVFGSSVSQHLQSLTSSTKETRNKGMRLATDTLVCCKLEQMPTKTHKNFLQNIFPIKVLAMTNMESGYYWNIAGNVNVLFVKSLWEGDERHDKMSICNELGRQCLVKREKKNRIEEFLVLYFLCCAFYSYS